MNPAPVQIVSRHRFEDMFLKSSHHWVISIREADEIGIPRPDFINPRVNLAFWDRISGPGIATPEDVESVYQFSLEWMKQVLEDPTKANLVCIVSLECLAARLWRLSRSFFITVAFA